MYVHVLKQFRVHVAPKMLAEPSDRGGIAKMPGHCTRQHRVPVALLLVLVSLRVYYRWRLPRSRGAV